MCFLTIYNYLVSIVRILAVPCWSRSDVTIQWPLVRCSGTSMCFGLFLFRRMFGWAAGGFRAGCLFNALTVSIMKTVLQIKLHCAELNRKNPSNVKIAWLGWDFYESGGAQICIFVLNIVGFCKKCGANADQQLKNIITFYKQNSIIQKQCLAQFYFKSTALWTKM